MECRACLRLLHSSILKVLSSWWSLIVSLVQDRETNSTCINSDFLLFLPEWVSIIYRSTVKIILFFYQTLVKATLKPYSFLRVKLAMVSFLCRITHCYAFFRPIFFQFFIRFTNFLTMKRCMFFVFQIL